MNKLSDRIVKDPQLKPARDYYGLRREGIGFIEQMASARWTDYNTHDPGITILESLCYAITDLAYRVNWDIADLMMPEAESADPEQPYPDQAFFTAREILTVNPLTTDDFRRLVIDLEKVRNAWVFCRECVCETGYYAWCEHNQLQLGYRKPELETPTLTVQAQGLYDVLLELEADPELGDLNDRKIEHRFSAFDAEGDAHETAMELRFPDWGLANPQGMALFLASEDAFQTQNGASFSIQAAFGAAKGYNLLADPSLNDEGRDRYLRDHWQRIWFVDFELELQPSAEKIRIASAALCLFGDPIAKNQMTAERLRKILEENSAAGFIGPYREKVKRIQASVRDAKAALQSNRNLDEDFCRIATVGIEEVSVCADVELVADADIERVQAEIWLRIEEYLNPPVPFYGLQELLDEQLPVEEIFNGPQLSNGFIKASDLQNSSLKPVLRVSDLLNSLMDIEGVNAVNNLLLSKYDAEGNLVKGAADPKWSADGKVLFDPTKISAAWLLFLSPLHLPRLQIRLSRFLFFKNGLPFLPRRDEAADTLIQLRGERERPKILNAQNDLPAPRGVFRNPSDYFPLQYGFPQTYGIGPAGLALGASAARKAKARQLKAYLLVFEQLLGNAFAQIAQVAGLFSLDQKSDRSYFVTEFSDTLIQGYNDLVAGLDSAKLQAITETEAEFCERRNRFLNHVMARFGEQFSEYARLISRSQGLLSAQKRLIEDKLAFLAAYPRISHDRGRAFDHLLGRSQDNQAGIQKRVSLLLGFPDLRFEWESSGPDGGPYAVSYQLDDRHSKSWITGNLDISADNPGHAEQRAYDVLLTFMSRANSYRIDPDNAQFRLVIQDSGTQIGQSELGDKNEIEALQNELIAWSANQRAILVEHLLLRPKFPGDALYPACVGGDCRLCGDEDPYSFRLTWVMPAWAAPYSNDLELRAFADRTIRKETPAHLLSKICWVGNDGFVANPCDPVIDALADWLFDKGLTRDNTAPERQQSCDCAATLYGLYSEAFNAWYADKSLVFFEAQLLDAELRNILTSVDTSAMDCAIEYSDPLRSGVESLLLDYFKNIVARGWQFERFDETWRLWLQAEAAIDWSEERLQERLRALLTANLPEPIDAELCDCIQEILSRYGDAFYQDLKINIEQRRDFDALTPFEPIPVLLTEQDSDAIGSFCPNLTFKAGASAAVQDLLDTRYTAYREVSYRLWRVVNALADLHSVYPAATLHDCDDGSDFNPVRLGNTSLGSA